MLCISSKSLAVNYMRLRHKSGRAAYIYQYNVTFDPLVDSIGVRSKLLFQHCHSVLGNAKSFNGTALFLPKKLDHEVP